MSGHQSVRVDNDTYEVLRRHAAGEDRPIARVLRSAVDLYDETRQGREATERLRASGEALAVSLSPAVREELQKDVLVLSGACGHPKDQERRLAWGTVCGACGAKLR